MSGDYLKKHREEAGFSLQDISARTLIGLKYLAALEDGDYKSLPGDIYVKGYIRAYMSTLSLDPAEALRIYAEEERRERASLVAAFMDKERLIGSERFVRRLFQALDRLRLILYSPVMRRAAFSALVILLLLPLAFSLFHKKNDRNSNRVASMIPALLDSAEADYANKHLLEIRAVEDTWISIRIDDNLTYSMHLKPGQKRSWAGEKSFFLKIGNAGGIRITFDGKYLGAPGKRGHVVRIALPEKPAT